MKTTITCCCFRCAFTRAKKLNNLTSVDRQSHLIDGLGRPKCFERRAASSAWPDTIGI